MESLTRHAWQAAFVSYCNGAPPDEISQIFDIPPDTLRRKMADESWAKLRDKLPLGEAVALPAKINAKLEVINENRRINLEGWKKARDFSLQVLTALAEGRLRIKKSINLKAPAKPRKSSKKPEGDGDAAQADGNREQREAPATSITVEVEPSPADILTIVTYFRTITEGTYRALGDFQGERVSSDANATPTAPAPPSITIILPAAIAVPREKRVLEGYPVEIESVTPASPRN